MILGCVINAVHLNGRRRSTSNSSASTVTSHRIAGNTKHSETIGIVVASRLGLKMHLFAIEVDADEDDDQNTEKSQRHSYPHSNVTIVTVTVV